MPGTHALQWGAYDPDLPGCISTGETFEEVQRNIKEGIELHTRIIPMASSTAERAAGS